VFAWPAVVVPCPAVVLPWPAVVFECDCGVERVDAALCEGADECWAGACCAGALACEAGADFGAGAEFVFFWPHAKTGTAINSNTAAQLRIIVSLFKVRFITAS